MSDALVWEPGKHPQTWTAKRGRWILDLWEVAAMPGWFQWQAHTTDHMGVTGGEEPYSERSFAEADADLWTR